MTVRILLWCMFAMLAPSCMDEPAVPSSSAADVADTFTCSMHPQVVQDGPGSCPLCGMDLTPRQMNRTSPHHVEVQPGIIQQMGVETRPAARTAVVRTLRTLGEVEVGEDELSVVNLRLSGWAERVRVDKTGAPVKTGEVLFELYSPELVAAQEEYLMALRSQGSDGALTQAARRRLELWNIAARDIEALARQGTAARTMPVRSPTRGFVLHKDLVEGGRVTAGRDLYRIGNLQRIWVRAEVYEHDAPWVAAGQAAQLELTHMGGEMLEGRVDYVYPTLDARTRTLPVRLEFDNPGVQLKPGMFATVHIQFQQRDDAIAVPTSAILHSGSRRIVFVAHGRGRFEPREVTTGLQGDERITEITTGLTEGELVVTSGQFLLDSEAQLQEALGKLETGSRGHAGDHRREAEPSDALPTTGPGAQQPAIDAPPGAWHCPDHPMVAAEGPGRCIVCGAQQTETPTTTDPR